MKCDVCPGFNGETCRLNKNNDDQRCSYGLLMRMNRAVSIAVYDYRRRGKALDVVETCFSEMTAQLGLTQFPSLDKKSHLFKEFIKVAFDLEDQGDQDTLKHLQAAKRIFPGEFLNRNLNIGGQNERTGK